jgi:LDH2 family malate/lactate/ureidoglycolate dehydrogenase
MTAPSSARVQLDVAEARAVAMAALRAIGYTEDETTILTDHMLDAALCGYEYSGLPKILQIAANPKSKQPRTPMRTLHETPVSVLFDGGNNSGMLTLDAATDVAIERAQAHGFAMIGVTNSWMSGRSAYFVERIARADLIGLHTVGSSSLVTPPGGARPSFGTNPIAFGFPTTAEPLVIDVSTAAFPGTELDFYVLLGLTLPEGVALDADGRPTTDPKAAKRGSLMPFGGHKGFALALAMQALGVLAGSGFNAAKDYGYLLIAFRPDLLLPLDDFKRELTATLTRLKTTPRQPGVTEIRLPSERAFRERARRMCEGIEIDRGILDTLVAMAQQQPPSSSTATQR